MKASWLGAGLLAASVLALPTTARAQDRWGRDSQYDRSDDYGRRGGRGQTFSLGYDRGLRDGARRGEQDARSRRGFDFRREGDYRDADNGYRGSYGPRFAYSRGYREGYEAGYRRSYSYNARGRDGRWDRDRDGRWDRDRRW